MWGTFLLRKGNKTYTTPGHKQKEGGEHITRHGDPEQVLQPGHPSGRLPVRLSELLRGAHPCLHLPTLRLLRVGVQEQARGRQILGREGAEQRSGASHGD